MRTELSTKHFVLVLTDKSKFFLDEKEADIVKEAIKRGDKYLEIGDSLISVFSFSKLIGSAEYEEAEKIREGMWKCSYNFYHQKGFSCGHRKGDQY
jgi:hypothetical protein